MGNSHIGYVLRTRRPSCRRPALCGVRRDARVHSALARIATPYLDFREMLDRESIDVVHRG
jgi:hypothetical protein